MAPTAALRAVSCGGVAVMLCREPTNIRPLTDLFSSLGSILQFILSQHVICSVRYAEVSFPKTCSMGRLEVGVGGLGDVLWLRIGTGGGLL
jgi:hypothetical protein